MDHRPASHHATRRSPSLVARRRPPSLVADRCSRRSASQRLAIRLACRARPALAADHRRSQLQRRLRSPSRPRLQSTPLRVLRLRLPGPSCVVAYDACGAEPRGHRRERSPSRPARWWRCSDRPRPWDLARRSARLARVASPARRCSSSGELARDDDRMEEADVCDALRKCAEVPYFLPIPEPDADVLNRQHFSHRICYFRRGGLYSPRLKIEASSPTTPVTTPFPKSPSPRAT